MIDALRKIFGNQRDQDATIPLYNAVVAAARQPHWYQEGQIPDTVDGRFDVLIALLSLILVRMEGMAGQERASVWMTELFVEDMDGQLRQIGVGDYTVGKHVGKIMGALGGRLEAFRDALAAGESLEPLIRRNIYTNAPPSDAALQHTVAALQSHWTALQPVTADDLKTGAIGW